MGSTGRARGLGAFAIAALALCAGATSAAAAVPAAGAPSPTVSVVPSSGLLDRQTVTVTASHFRASAQLAVIECDAKATGQADCDIGTTHFDSTDSTGTLTFDYVVHRVLRLGRGDTLDCAKVACVVAAATYPSLDQTARAALSFKDVPLPPPLDVRFTLGKAIAVEGPGMAVVTGVVTCNRAVTGSVGGSIVQYYGRFIFRSNAGIDFSCGSGSKGGRTRVRIEFQPTTGKFARGAADVELFLYASDGVDSVDASLVDTVQLRPVHP